MPAGNNTPDHRRLSALLKEIRVEREIRQADLAKILDVPQSFVSKYESGQRHLEFVQVRRICSALGIPFRQFVERFEKGH